MADQDLQAPQSVLFYEEQRPWPGFVAAAYVICIPAAAYFLWVLAEDLFFGRHSEGVWAAVLLLLPVLVVLFVAATARLIIEVRPDGLFVRYRPLLCEEQPIDLTDVESVLADSYWPIIECGGWGMRRSDIQTWYTIRGTRGVRIIYKRFETNQTNRMLLLGSQRPEELAAAIQQLLPQGQDQAG